MRYVKSFEPMESDPDILTKLMHRLGVHESFCFSDVLDFEEESHQPALALIIIFPETHEDELEKAAAEAKRKPIIDDNVKFLKQTIDNSCGLVAVIHCILNTVAVKSIKQNSILYNALESSKGIATFLEESKELELEYQSVVELGETEIPDEVKYHYTTLIGYEDSLYELDGERSRPLVKGTASRAGYILEDFEQMSQIINSFTHGRTDCSVFKLTAIDEVL